MARVEVYAVAERVGIHSRGTPGLQSRNSWVYTVPERLGLSRGTPGFSTVAERVGLDSRGTRGFRQSRNAWVYTVAERVDLHSLGTRGVTVTRNAWVYTVEERVDLQSRNAWFTQSRDAWI